MIKQLEQKSAGFSLYELLIAILLFSIVVSGFVKFESYLILELNQLKNRSQAQQFAFELLESYPRTQYFNTISGLTFKVKKLSYQSGCEIVTIEVQYKSENVMQTRWFCH